MEDRFEGFRPEAYVFLMELAYNNNKPWMDKNRDRYRELVQRPMQKLATLLLPDMLDIDPGFNPRLTTIVSRINRDTRYTKNKLPYRNHAWIAFRREGRGLGESLCMYFEISPEGYSYGMGMYSANSEFMTGLRNRAIADPEGFRRIVEDPALARYALGGEPYKKDRTPLVPDDIKPYLNRKGIGWSYDSDTLAPTMCPGIYDEVREAFAELAPAYKYMIVSMQD